MLEFLFADTPSPSYAERFPHIDAVVDELGVGTDVIYTAIKKVAAHVGYPEIIAPTDERESSMARLDAWIRDNYAKE